MKGTLEQRVEQCLRRFALGSIVSFNDIRLLVRASPRQHRALSVLIESYVQQKKLYRLNKGSSEYRVEQENPGLVSARQVSASEAVVVRKLHSPKLHLQQPYWHVLAGFVAVVVEMLQKDRRGAQYRRLSSMALRAQLAVWLGLPRNIGEHGPRSANRFVALVGSEAMEPLRAIGVLAKAGCYEVVVNVPALNTLVLQKWSPRDLHAASKYYYKLPAAVRERVDRKEYCLADAAERKVMLEIARKVAARAAVAV